MNHYQEIAETAIKHQLIPIMPLPKISNNAVMDQIHDCYYNAHQSLNIEPKQ